ncbi:MAG: PEP-CTERM sorting domain-containing protein [Betaproteobacteria bacterium]|nr:PEP-CTERM sorting domain-containing protein [Betaproteobacteria bacterium]
MFSSLSGLLGVDGDGILATISFKAMAVGVANLSFGDALLGNSSLDDIFFDNRFAGRASITIDRAPGGGGSVPEPATLALVALALTAAGASRRRAATPAIER